MGNQPEETFGKASFAHKTIVLGASSTFVHARRELSAVGRRASLHMQRYDYGWAVGGAYWIDLGGGRNLLVAERFLHAK
jgi:hypothetical protein